MNAEETSDESSEWGSAQLEMLHGAVEDELRRYNAIGEFGLPEEAIATLAWAVTTRLDDGFSIRWSPNWVEPGRPHQWQDEGGWHALCNDCLQDSPPQAEKADAIAWFDGHVAERHSAGAGD